jgi:hypothetical protein
MSALGPAIKFAVKERGDAESQLDDDLDRVPGEEVSDPIDKEIGAV